ncbi:EspF repeat-containing protein [Streptomyces niveus]
MSEHTPPAPPPPSHRPDTRTDQSVPLPRVGRGTCRGRGRTLRLICGA